MSVEIEIQRGKAYTVDRGGRSAKSPGAGMLRGLGIVFNHFVKSYGAKSSKKSDIAGTFTVEYPEERASLPEAYRNMPILLYDDASGQELCTSCFQCERICPPQVIHITQEKDPATGKAVPAVADFVIEYDACMSCGLCAEVCPFDAIKMDHAFELSTAEHPQLTVHREELNRPVSYYASIAPEMWEQAQAGAYKKLQGSLKRRTGYIGIAPQMQGKVPPVEPPAPPPARPAPPAAAATAPAPAEVAPAQELSPAEAKKAKLEAIRAAKAAQKVAGQGEGLAPAETPPPATPAAAAPAPAEAAPAQELSPAEAKKARLEAIRAAKAAQKADEQQETPQE
jgi:NADH-quinone oxidoreductase subunit I